MSPGRSILVRTPTRIRVTPRSNSKYLHSPSRIRISPKLKTKTRTFTKTQTKTKKPRTVRGGEGGTQSNFFTTLGKMGYPKSVKQLLDKVPQQCYNYNASTVISNSNSVQDVSGRAYLNITDLGYLRSQIANVLGGNATGTTAGALQTDIYMDSVDTELFLTNQTNFTGRIKIYDIMTRRDTISSLTPEACWSDGMTWSANNSLAYLHPGTTPYSSKLFCQQFLVKKMTEIILPAGCVHLHKGHVEINKKYPSAISSFQATNGLDQIGKWTHHQLIVVHGFPVSASDNSALCSLGAIKLDTVFNIKYKFRLLSPGQVSRNIYTNNLSLTGTEQGITEDGDVVASRTFA